MRKIECAHTLNRRRFAHFQFTLVAGYIKYESRMSTNSRGARYRCQKKTRLVHWLILAHKNDFNRQTPLRVRYFINLQSPMNVRGEATQADS